MHDVLGDRPGARQAALLVGEVGAGERGDHAGLARAPRTTSIRVIRACANGLRRNARCSMPGSVMLSVQWVRPVISRASSLRRRARPTSGGECGLAVMPACSRPSLLGHGSLAAPRRAPAAARRTARTMFW